jgi:hypothetical protein
MLKEQKWKKEMMTMTVVTISLTILRVRLAFLRRKEGKETTPSHKQHEKLYNQVS